MDIETYEKKTKVVPYIMVLKSSLGITKFYKNGEDIIALFLNQIERESLKLKLKNAEVYTHNINFDGYIIIGYFLEKGIPFKWFMRELNLYFLEFTYKGCSIRIRCSYKILPLSVEKLGEVLNKPKEVFPHKFMSEETLNYKGITPSADFFNNPGEYDKFCVKWEEPINIKNIALAYSAQDAQIVWESLQNLFQISNRKLLKSSFSFSSYSYKVFSKDFDAKRVCKERLNLDERLFIEESYFGGRTEIFGNTNDGFIHRFDFPGMYGSCMKEKFPYGRAVLKTPSNFDEPGIYTVTVFSELKIPLLPVRCDDGKIRYYNGKFTTRLPRDEFLFFIEKGGKILKIHSALVYSHEDYVFKDFVEYFNQIKERGGFCKVYGKSVINGLYGSFALRKDKYKHILLHDESELNFLIEEKRVSSFVKHDRFIIAKVENKECLDERENRNFAYAAFISSKARLKLHKSVYEVDDYYTKKYKNNYKLLYLETDSIDVALPEKCLGESVGEVKWQKIFEGGVYISPKFYLLKGENPKIKGIREVPYTYQEIKETFFESKADLLFKSQLYFKHRNFELCQEYVDKTLKISSYDKRYFSDDKLNTEAVWVVE